MPDPTRAFSLLVMGIMCVRFLEANEWNFELLLDGLFLNPYVVGSFLIGALVWWASGGIQQLCHKSDQYVAEWYWWNGIWFHWVLDGFTGSLWKVPVVLHQYRMLDRRFTTGHVVPYMVGMIELIFMGPTCLLVFWMIVKQHPLRYPCELMLSGVQLMGMVLFLAAELYDEQVNVPALDPVGMPGNAWANIKFDTYHCTYYWFGFWVCNFVWCFVPGFRMYRALQVCDDMFRKDKGAKTQ